jgi:hypothetical protein
MAYLFKLSSRLIVERHLPTIASDAYGIGFVEETRTTRDQILRVHCNSFRQMTTCEGQHFIETL